jgi:hypothetical protein
MPSSRALTEWKTVRKEALDELFGAHARLGGTGAGRRYATRELNHAMVAAISAQFQGFCRELFEEANLALADRVQPSSLRTVVYNATKVNLQLDRGNAHEGSLGSDFSRLGMEFWKLVGSRTPARTAQYRKSLKQLNIWRNAIVHNDFKFKQGELQEIQGTTAQLRDARRWRAACDGLAKIFDVVLRDYLTSLLGLAPW